MGQDVTCRRALRITGMSWKRFASVIILLLACTHTSAANTPCSGKKGGISRCENGHFVCNDGSVSASKRQCSQDAIGPTVRTRAAQSSSISAPQPTAPATNAPQRNQGTASQSCPCGSGMVCTGQHNGTYCLLPSGQKKYQKRQPTPSASQQRR